MRRFPSLTTVFLTLLCAVVLYLIVSERPVYGGFQSGVPVRCYVWINTSLVDQNVPMLCTTPDGNEYYNVPEGLYLYVTDVFVRPRLTTQSTVAASVRIWEENYSSTTGCDASGSGVTGSFVVHQYLTLADTSIRGQEHIAYNTPYLVLTPNDCLAVYTSTPAGLVVEISGYQWTSLGVPVSTTFLPSVMSGN